MCLAVPGRLIDIQPGDPLIRTGRVTFGGAIKEVSLACTPEAKVGDYVLVHVGLALSVVDPQEAVDTWRYLQEMGDLDEITAPPGSLP